MDTGVLLTVVLSRAIERLAAILVGAGSVFLGYRLFIHIPNVDRSEGKIRLPGGVSIFLTRVGPGVFFALFGCLVVGYSVTRPIDFSVGPFSQQNRNEYVSAGNSENEIHYRGFGPTLRQTVDTFTFDPIILVGRLNYYFLDDQFRVSSKEGDAQEIMKTLNITKLSLMNIAWKNDWGNRDQFIKWVSSGATAPVPEELRGAFLIFRSRQR